MGKEYPVFVAERVQQGQLRRWAVLCFKRAGFSVPRSSNPFSRSALMSYSLVCQRSTKASWPRQSARSTRCDRARRRVERLSRGRWPCEHATSRRGIRTVGISHGTVNGCTTEHGVTMAVGFDREFSARRVVRSAVRRIHARSPSSQAPGQWERAGRTVSVSRFHRTVSLWRRKGAKGVPALGTCMQAGNATASLIETPRARRLCIDFDGPPDMARLAEIASGRERQVRAGALVVVDEEHRAGAG